MSLGVEGVWAVGVWDQTVWATDVWREGAWTGAILANPEAIRSAMPTDTARFHDFITATGITKTGDLTTDYRRALHSASGASGDPIDYSVQDLYKRYFESL